MARFDRARPGQRRLGRAGLAGARARGFTLVELLVALAAMALLSLLSWRGLDTMARTQAQTQERADQVLSLQAGLNQWNADLDATLSFPQVPAIDWDGRALRITRRSSDTEAAGPWVVAWTRRDIGGAGQWLRWQSPVLRSRADLLQAWDRAALWAQNPSDEDRRREVAVSPLLDWRIFYYRSDAWTNPLSSAETTRAAATTGGVAAAAVGAAAVGGNANLPDGVRLVLTLPPGRALAGSLTRDWIRPVIGGGKS